MTNLPVWNPITKKWTLEQVGSLWVPAQVNGQQQQQIVALDGLLAMIGNGSGGGGGGGGVRSFNGRKGIVVSEFGDYGTDLIENDSADTFYTGLTTATEMFDLIAEYLGVARQAITVTNPVAGQIAALTTGTTLVLVTSDDDTNTLLVPAGLTYADDNYRTIEILNRGPNAISLTGAVAQTWNDISGTYLLSPKMSVRIRLVNDNSWSVIASGPSQLQSAIAVAAGTTAIPALAAQETVYEVDAQAVGVGVSLPVITAADLALGRTIRISDVGAQALDVTAGVGNTINTVDPTISLAAGEGTVFKPSSSTNWHVVVGGTIVP